MASERYNHYVPQFLLKKFSHDKKTIGMFIKSGQNYIKNAKIKKLAGEYDLYGKSGVLEKAFSEFEFEWSNILNKIDSTKKLPQTKLETSLLRMFIYYSDIRTLEVANTFVNNITEFADKAKILIDGNKSFSKGVFREVDFVENHIKEIVPNAIFIEEAPQILRLMEDLELVLIQNLTEIPFIISDCPVIKYNLYLKNCPNCNGYGYAQKGFFCLIPIGKHSALALLDKSIYKYKKNGNLTIDIKNREDILELNKLMAYQAKEYIFFDNSVEKEYVEKIGRLTKSEKEYDFSKLLVVHIKTRSVFEDISISFLKLKKKPLNIIFEKENIYIRKAALKAMKTEIPAIPEKYKNMDIKLLINEFRDI